MLMLTWHSQPLSSYPPLMYPVWLYAPSILPIVRLEPHLSISHNRQSVSTAFPGTHIHRQQVDFAHYKNVVKNQKVLSELEQAFKSFKPVDYDVGAQLKAIDAFQEKAVGGDIQ